ARYLRGKMPGSFTDKEKKQLEKLAGGLDGALEDAKLPEDVTVFRGFVNSSLPEKLSDLVGKTVTDKSYVSTTILPGKAEGFIHVKDGIIAELRLPKGYNAGYVEKVSRHPEEKEVLIPRNRSFKIMGFIPASESPHELDTLIMEPT